MLIEYLRDKNGSPVGVVVALGKEDIGWSLCNKRDRFNKQRALEIAVGRSYKRNISDTKPVTILPLFNKVYARAQRYFK